MESPSDENETMMKTIENLIKIIFPLLIKRGQGRFFIPLLVHKLYKY
jgi:hypothetical protein